MYWYSVAQSLEQWNLHFLTFHCITGFYFLWALHRRWERYWKENEKQTKCRLYDFKHLTFYVIFNWFYIYLFACIRRALWQTRQTTLSSITTGLLRLHKMATSRLVEHYTGIAEVMGSNPVQTKNYFRFSFRNCWQVASLNAMVCHLISFILSSALQIYVFPLVYLLQDTNRTR